MSEAPTFHHGDWPLRPWILAALLGLAGLAVWFAANGFESDLAPWRAAATAFLFFGPLAAAFALDRQERAEPGLFGLLVGAVMAGIAWRVANADPQYDSSGFWLAAGVVASALALPLFQAGFHRHRWATSYARTHYHVWTDAITAGGALAFTGLVWLVLALLAELFHAIRIDLLRDAMAEGWFGWLFSGVAFGAALGTLRNQLTIIGTLQNVVLLVFSLIAVPLAVALVLFLLAVLLSGMDVLWEATRSATPLLLALAAGSFVLVNAVLRDGEAEASGSRIMRLAALVLALGILPLASLAAVSMGFRIAQHGLTPERIWGLIAVAVAVAFGIAYLVGAIRSRALGWDGLRRANLHLAVATCAIALLLAMPILDFGAISARNQIARLESGKVDAAQFDFAALRWDFGAAGRAALARLAKQEGKTGELAAEALRSTSRPPPEARIAAEQWPGGRPPLSFGFTDQALQDQILRHVRSNPWICSQRCVAIDLGADDGRSHVAIVGQGVVHHVRFREDGIAELPEPRAPAGTARAAERITPDGIEVRQVTRRQIYVEGEPVGEPFP